MYCEYLCNLLFVCISKLNVLFSYYINCNLNNINLYRDDHLENIIIYLNIKLFIVP